MLNDLDRSECLQTPEWPQTPECLQSASPSNSTSGGLNVEWVCRFAVEPITHFASKEGQTSLLRRFTHCLRSPKRLHGRFGQNHENMFCSLFNSCKLLKCEFETVSGQFVHPNPRFPRNAEFPRLNSLVTPPDSFFAEFPGFPRNAEFLGYGNHKPVVVSLWFP